MSDKQLVVQIGLDEDVFNENAAQDSRSRQVAYGNFLKKKNIPSAEYEVFRHHYDAIAGDVFFDNVLLTDENGPDPVPIPSTILLFGSGLAGLVGKRIRRKKK